MTQDTYTENLGDFGYREIALLKDILVQWCEGAGLPQAFENDGIRPAMNKNSGYVFLVNADYQTAMINPDSGELELFLSTPQDGKEGFLKDLLQEYKPDDLNADDAQYLVDAIQHENLADSFIPKEWQGIIYSEEDAA